ncbi:MAG: DNA topoisomerase VI subunit B [Candidatus Hadarchaeales archaeon]
MKSAADELFKEFREHSVSEFFRKNAAMLGYTGKIRSLTTIIHEGVTNSIDASEEMGILPKVYVAIKKVNDDPEHFRVVLEDNASGIPEKFIPDVFGKMLAGTKLHRHQQQRGQQGIGVCMTGDTYVPLSDGSIKRIADIVASDMRNSEVIALGQDLRLRGTKIVKCWKIPAPSQMVELKVLTGRKIRLTPENPVLVLREGEPTWIEARDVKRGMFIAAARRLPVTPAINELRTLDILKKDGLRVDLPELTSKFVNAIKKKHGSLRKASKQLGISYGRLRSWSRKMPNGNPHGRPTLAEFKILAKENGITEISDLITRIGRNGSYVNIPPRVNAELMWFVGAMAGDGHVGSPTDNRWGYSLFFHNKDKELVNRMKKALRELFGLEAREYFDERVGNFTLETSSSIVAEILNYFGVPPGDKTTSLHLPEQVLNLSDDLVKAYLRGLFDTDGGLSRPYREVTFGLMSREVVEKTVLLLLRFGIISRFRENRKKDKLSYQLVISGKENLTRFANTIGFTSRRKRELLQKFIKSIKLDSTNLDLFPGIQDKVGKLYRWHKIPYKDIPGRVWSSFYKQCMTQGTLTKALGIIEDLDDPSVELEYLRTIANSDLIWLKVTNTKMCPAPEPYVYDLTVENSHNFVANGLIVHNSGACMFAQITSGRPTTVTTSTGDGEITQMDVMIDVDKNEGKVLRKEKIRGKWRGTRVEFDVRDVAYMRSRYGPFNYLKMTAIANPHVHITFVEPDGVMTVFENATDKVPEVPKPMPLHPWGIMADDLLTLAKRTKARNLATFLSTELSRVSKNKAGEVCRLAGVLQTKKPSELTWEEAERIVSAFKQVKLLAPPTSGLRPIGAQEIEKGMRQILNPEFLHVVTRPPKVYRGGLPFIVEVGIAYGGNAGKPLEGKNMEGEGEAGMDIMRFANRAPLIFDQGGCAITLAAKSIDWRRYGIDPEADPVTLFVNVSSAYVPYTSAGKQSIADEPEIVDEIRAAMMEAARELRKYLYRKIRSKEKQERAGIFERYLPIIARKAAKLAGMKEPDIKPLLKRITGVDHAEA